MTVLKSRLNIWDSQLTGASVPYPRQEATAIIAVVLGCAPELIDEQLHIILTDSQIAAIDHMIADRVRRIPLPRITGHSEMCGLNLRVADGVYRPYPESEVFVDLTVMALSNSSAPLRVLDLGTGSGCLLLGLINELPNASGVGVDNDDAALALARENAAANHLSSRTEFRHGNWGDGLTEQFDLVVSNPPRVATLDISRLVPEMRDHDPVHSLDGGHDGLDCFRAVIRAFTFTAKPDAIGAFQVGPKYADAVAKLLKNEGFETIEVRVSLQGQPVAVMVRNRKRLLSLNRFMPALLRTKFR
jgi:release factor glutamine methyltransferase